MYKISGSNVLLSGLVLTCRNFTKNYGYKLPKQAPTLVPSYCYNTGPIEIEKEVEVKIVNCSIYWVKRNGKPHIDRIPFAWLFGDIKYIYETNPYIQAEADFHNFLLGRLYEIVTGGYKVVVDKKIRHKVFIFYKKLVDQIEKEAREYIVTTQADEHLFQQLLNKYKFFLYPEAISIRSQPTIWGKPIRRPDFLIEVSQEQWIYVEIESPYYKPFENLKPSNRLNEALKQIEEWKKILNKQASKKIISYMVIIGLLEDMKDEEKENLRKFNEKHRDITIKTWDYIIEKINKTKSWINKLKQR